MKINWYSPPLRAKTGIADFSAAVLPALRERFDVTLRTDPDIAPADAAASNSTPRSDAHDTINVFNIGNSFEFHGKIFKEAQRRPGILLMHDTVLTDFFHHYLADLMPNGDFAFIASQYGRETAEALAARRRGEAGIIPPGVQMRLLGATLNNALCAVAFTDDSFNALKRDGTCPVYRLDLPFRLAEPMPADVVPDTGRLLMFGHFGDNRRIAEVLAAIGTHPRRNQLRLDIFGQYHDEAGLRRLMAQFDLSAEQVRYHGHVPDDVLDRAIASAALVVNLRYPSMGEASLSQLRAWSLGAATIVTPVAWYAALPPDTVLAAPLEREREALHDAFTLALDRPETLAAVGAAGRAHLERRHSPQAFVNGLAGVLDDLPAMGARWTVERLTCRAAVAAAPWKSLLTETNWQGVAAALSGLAPAAFRNAAALAEKRFLSGKTDDSRQYVEAAQGYVAKLSERDRQWLYHKPYDTDPGNGGYFTLQYQVMNLLQAMQVRPGGRILEVGAGPGWITEQLLMLGFSVDALEPAQALIDIAQQRCAALAQHYGTQDAAKRVSFQCATMEQATFAAHRFDAVIFYDVLHHIFDENTALAKCMEVLRPGGILGIVEGSWSSADRHLEALLQEEMQTYGTLENPFSPEYLDELLTQTGFVDITRYFPVNGFFPSAMRNQLLIDAAGAAAIDTNNLIARKPYGSWPTTASSAASTAGEIAIKSGGIEPQTRMAKLTVALKNTGETVWLPARTGRGGVTLALRRGAPGAADFQEAPYRYRLPEVLPKDLIVVNAQYSIPPGAPLDGWTLDLISEECFWFSTFGSETATIATTPQLA